MVLHGASGVPAGYDRFSARYAAAAHGLVVLTHANCDVGAQAQRHARHSRASKADRGLRDQAAALAVLGPLFPGVPRWVPGHSLGGPWLGHHPVMERVMTLKFGPIHVSDHPLPLRARAMGYLPGRLLRTTLTCRCRFAGNGVAAAWRRGGTVLTPAAVFPYRTLPV
jgi:predicted alpha/beta hydrolase